MEASIVFDRVVQSLGFRSGAALAAKLGRNRQSASNWRTRGFPKVVYSDLMVLAGQMGKPLPREFYEMTGIPAPGAHSEASEGASCASI